MYLKCVFVNQFGSHLEHFLLLPLDIYEFIAVRYYLKHNHNYCMSNIYCRVFKDILALYVISSQSNCEILSASCLVRLYAYTAAT